MHASLLPDLNERCRDLDGDGEGSGANHGCMTRLSSFDDTTLMVGGAPDFQDMPGDIFGMLLDDATADVPILGNPAAASSAMDACHDYGGPGRRRATVGAGAPKEPFDASLSELLGPGPCAPRHSLSGECLGGAVNALQRLEHHRGNLTVHEPAPDGAASSGACSVGSIGAAGAAPCGMGGLANVYAMSPS